MIKKNLKNRMVEADQLENRDVPRFLKRTRWFADYNKWRSRYEHG
jgi:hypothetical protein